MGLEHLQRALAVVAVGQRERAGAEAGDRPVLEAAHGLLPPHPAVAGVGAQHARGIVLAVELGLGELVGLVRDGAAQAAVGHGQGAHQHHERQRGRAERGQPGPPRSGRRHPQPLARAADGAGGQGGDAQPQQQSRRQHQAHARAVVHAEAVGGQAVAQEHRQDGRHGAGDARGQGRAQAQALGPQRDGQRRRQHQDDDPPARVGQRQRGQQQHHRHGRGHPRRGPVAQLHDHAHGQRHRDHAHQPQRVPVVQRRAQAREAIGVVQVDQAADVQPREQLAAERVERDHGGDGQHGQAHALGRAREAGAQHDAQPGHQRVGQRPVGLEPALVGGDRPRDRQRRPAGERHQQRHAPAGRRRGLDAQPRAVQQPAEGGQRDQRHRHLQPALLGDADRAVGERRVEHRHRQRQAQERRGRRAALLPGRRAARPGRCGSRTPAGVWSWRPSRGL